MDDHLRHCVTDAVQASPEQGNEKLAEVNRAVALALRLQVGLPACSEELDRRFAMAAIRHASGERAQFGGRPARAVLEASALRKSYHRGVWPVRRNVAVLTGVDLQLLTAGEVVGLVGENAPIGSRPMTAQAVIARLPLGMCSPARNRSSPEVSASTRSLTCLTTSLLPSAVTVLRAWIREREAD